MAFVAILEFQPMLSSLQFMSSAAGATPILSSIGTNLVLLISRMAEMGMDKGTGPVSFGQLLGMCDQVSLALGESGGPLGHMPLPHFPSPCNNVDYLHFPLCLPVSSLAQT